MPFSYDIHCTHPYTGFCIDLSWFYCKIVLWHVYVPNQFYLHLLVFLKPYLLFYISLGGNFYFVSVIERVFFWLCWVFIAVLKSFSRCSTQALERRLSGCGKWAWFPLGMRDLGRQTTNRTYAPTMEGGFLTTGSPRKSLCFFCVFFF